ncbi:MAG: hypothetical protein F6K41_38005 [Symploca sp. SIO3E6]|nr:hypothetical protein [Caldora sp. SIO3E6]
MTVEITLNLSESLVESAQRLGDATQRQVEIVLCDVLTMLLPALENLSDSRLCVPVSSLSDEQILMLAESTMNVVQNQRLSELQAKGKTTVGLTEAESYELLALMQVYQLGLLRKSEALAEAVKRGLQTPLHP